MKTKIFNILFIVCISSALILSLGAFFYISWVLFPKFTSLVGGLFIASFIFLFFADIDEYEEDEKKLFSKKC